MLTSFPICWCFWPVSDQKRLLP